MKHLYLDQTHVTNKGLQQILWSMKESLKVRTISFESCDLNLEGDEGQEIVEIIKQNISLTKLGYDKNETDDEFEEAIDKELTFNK